MAKMEPIKGKITVELSPEDRRLLKKIVIALGVDPEDEDSIASTLRRLAEHPVAEGDWLLEVEDEAGDDVD